MTILERSHLEIVRAVDEHGSLTVAAEHLHLMQSALSHAVRKLKRQLGLAIWHREGRRLRPTDVDEYLPSQADRLQPRLARAEGPLDQFACGERGTLRIGMECHPCYQWLLRIVVPYLAAWPTVDTGDRHRTYKQGTKKGTWLCRCYWCSQALVVRYAPTH